MLPELKPDGLKKKVKLYWHIFGLNCTPIISMETISIEKALFEKRTTRNIILDKEQSE